MSRIDVQAASEMDDHLRQIVPDTALLHCALAESRDALEQARRDGDPLALQSAFGVHGETCRIAGTTFGANGDPFFIEGEAMLQEALSLARQSGSDRTTVAALIRLGELQRCRGQYSVAVRTLREALDLSDSPTAGGYREFALQHLGKALVQAGEPLAAVPLLEEALALREAMQAESRAASTKAALAWARQHIAGE